MQKQNFFASRRVVVTGMLAAMIAVLMVTGIGMLRIGPAASVTFLCLPVLVGVMAEGLPVGILLGGAFGIISFVQALSSPMLLSPFFINPLVSVVPRLLIPVVAWASLKALRPLSRKGGGKRMLARGIAALLGSLTNTVLVLSMIFLMTLLGAQVEGMGVAAIGAVLLSLALTNGLPEAICMALVVPPVLAALDRSIYKNQELP